MAWEEMYPKCWLAVGICDELAGLVGREEQQSREALYAELLVLIVGTVHLRSTISIRLKFSALYTTDVRQVDRSHFYHRQILKFVFVW